LNASGLNEFIKNYADDVKDVITYISNKESGKKINVIAHSLGSHQLLRTLQEFKNLNSKIRAICCIAGSYDMGANRFNATFNKVDTSGSFEHYADYFYDDLRWECERFFKSKANQHQYGVTISKTNNPALVPEMNENISVHYGPLDCFPPLFLVHAKDDPNVFFQNSILLGKKTEQHTHSVVGGLFLEKGGHHFLKDTGNAEIRIQAFNAINNFLSEPGSACFKENLDTISYENVMEKHSLFLKDQNTYLLNHYQSRLDEEKIEFKI